MPPSTPEPAGPVCAGHGEGPVWDPATNTLYWVDMLAGDVLCQPAGAPTPIRRHVGEVAAAVRPRRGGGLVVAVERGFALFNPDDGTLHRLPELWSDPSVRMNDGGCDPQGRFYCGSMAYDEASGRGELYRLDPDHTATRVLRDLTISNGLVWSPDGALAYHVDTPTHRIDALDFDPDAGTLHRRRPVVTIPPDLGVPDGLTIDADGHLWVALWTGGAVHRYSPTGDLEARLTVPVAHVTACTFGDADLSTLYITTSRVDQTDDEPHAGALFRARPGVTGRPVIPFGG